VFLIGERTDGGFARFHFPEPDSTKDQDSLTVRGAIADLLETPKNGVPNHIWDRLSPLNIERIRSVGQGQGRDSLPLHLQIASQRRNPTHRHLDTYGRMSWDTPAPTITARFDSFSRGRFGHPVADRSISLREGARLQTFPDWFEFVGTKVSVARQIGNAVPPALAERIGLQVKRVMESYQSSPD